MLACRKLHNLCRVHCWSHWSRKYTDHVFADLYLMFIIIYFVNKRPGVIKKHSCALKSKSSWIVTCEKIHIFQCVGKISCVEFQRYPLKFRAKYLTHTLKNMIVKQHWNFKSSEMQELIRVFETHQQKSRSFWSLFQQTLIFYCCKYRMIYVARLWCQLPIG